LVEKGVLKIALPLFFVRLLPDNQRAQESREQVSHGLSSRFAKKENVSPPEAGE
jgi:hypothetical protein